MRIPKTQLQQPELPLWGVTEAPPQPLGEARRVLVGDTVVPYVLRRSRRRTIGLTIDHAGLRVGAPARAAQKDIEALIQRHGEWILSKLSEWVGRDRRPTTRVIDGATIPYLGAPATVRIETGGNRFVWDGTTLTLHLAPGSSPPEALRQALCDRAKFVFAERLARYAADMGLAVPRLGLSSARMRWGSCHRERGVRLNWRLIHMPQRLIDYVVVHELAHLRQMNHSPRFWHEVGLIIPDYRECRQELRTAAARLPDFV